MCGGRWEGEVEIVLVKSEAEDEVVRKFHGVVTLSAC